MTIQKRWEIAPPVPSDYLAELRDLPPRLAQLLYNRNLREPDAARAFLENRVEDDSPFSLKGIHRTVERLRRAIKQGESVVVYGDFDADGVTATTLLTRALQMLGANVRPYIPHRVDEGYGLNSDSLRNLADEGAQIIITVDCGIRSVQEVEDANRHGLEMIISDHHSIGPQLPPALAIINPKQAGCKYPEKQLAGVGIAYKIAQALHAVEQHIPLGNGSEWSPDELLDLVAIGTVADLVPLINENRVLVQRGLELLNNPQRDGLLSLYKVAGVEPGHINATTIGFAIGPRINAAGRLEHAQLAYDLLSADDVFEASEMAQQLHQINQRRQQLTADMQELAVSLSETDNLGELPLIFAAHEEFEPGIVGLVASRLTEANYRPSVVVEVGEDVSHGSCRSVPEFNITNALDQCADLLVRHGGHAAAAGFTVRTENIESLSVRLTEIAAEEMDGQMWVPTLKIDTELELPELTWDFVNMLSWLEPTGQQNAQALFVSRNVEVASKRTIGRDSSHLKMVVRHGDNTWDAIAFRQGYWVEDMPEQVDIVYHFEVNEWRGRRSLQLNVQDIHPAAGE